MTRHSQTRGFSLIELMVVLVIVVGIAAITGPRVTRIKGTLDLQSQVRDIVVLMRDARREAMASQRSVAVTVDVQQKTIARRGAAQSIALAPTVAVGLRTAGNERVNDTLAQIRFYPDGGSTGALLTLVRDQRRYEIAVDWLTGQVSANDPRS